MRRHSLFGLIFILLAGLLYNSYATSTNKITGDILGDEELLMQAIESTGFKMEEFNINKSVFISDTFLTIEELETKRKDIMDTLNIKGEIVNINIDEMYNDYHEDYFEDPLDIESDTILEQKVEEEGYNEIITLIPKEDGNVTLIKLLSTHIVGESETYIIVDIVENKRYKEIVDISNQVENILKENKNIERIFTNIGGGDGDLNLYGTRSNLSSVDGKLVSYKKRSDTTEEIIDRLRSRVSKIPGATISISTISSTIGFSSGGAEIQLEIRGEDLEILEIIFSLLLTSLFNTILS